ncbi:MAG: GNAT family N-acetyltransferase, partial [Maribacter sp.]|nr:GNAT family N-acetyltransferase [Maribacter sp.]
MIRIAKLNKSHNQEMLHIMNASPMKTPFIEVLFDKGPNISLLNEVWAKKYSYYGIFDNTLLLGFGSCLEYDGYFDRSKYSFSYLGNFCIHPDYRQQGLFKKLTEFILQEAYKKENICFCLVLQGNTSIERYFKNKDFQFHGLRNFTVFATCVT